MTLKIYTLRRLIKITDAYSKYSIPNPENKVAKCKKT
jgi:hypothetical protein